MDKTEIILRFETERLEALEYHLKKERTSVKKQLDEALQKLYEDKVPEPLREYIDSKTVSEHPGRPARRQADKTTVSDRQKDHLTEGGDQHAGNGI